MSQFGSGMSDPIVTDGDKSFMGVNQRLQINELQPGEVRESLNGRMDGYWKPRKAVVARSAGISTGGRTLTLPFFVINAAKTISAATWSDKVVTLTTTSAHGLTGSAYATLGNTVAGSVPPLTNADPTKVPPAGNYFMKVASATTLTFDFTNATGTGTYTVSGTTGYLHSQLNDGAVSDIFGSCLYSNPSTTNNEFILVATNTDVKKILLDPPYTITSIALPPATTIDSECHMLQAFDKVLIFREGKQALQWNGNVGDRFYKVASGPYTQPITFGSAGNTAFAAGVATVTVTTFTLLTASVTATGATTIVLPAYFDDGSPVSEIDDFYNGAAIQVNSATATTVANYVASTRTITLTAGALTSGTSYSLNSLQTSGAVPGFVLEIRDVPASVAEISIGDRIVIASVPKYNKFTFATSHSGGPHQIDFSYLESIGGGFSHMPAPPWATYFQRRLWVPYWYEVGGTVLSPSFTNRGIKDEIMASDIFDSDTYDQISAQFRITGGIADYTVAMQPFYDDALMVLNRNSLHLIAGTQGTLSDTVVKELTSEVGCLARKSVVIQGPNVFFLSDNGVYGLTFVEQYNLRGIEMPISVNIQPYIDRINKKLADHSVGVYFNNRYWLAVPLDSRVGGDNAIGNNTVLIYNFLNKGWESIDTYNDSRFNILNFHIGKSGQRNALYIVTTTGGLHEVDVNESASDVLAVDPALNAVTARITSRLTSRGYDMGSLERKRFTDTQIQMQSLDIESDCNLQISFSSNDPDASEQINTTAVLVGETLGFGDTANVRARLGGIRGFTGTLVIERIYGSPKINSIAVSGSATNRQIITQN